MLAAAADGDLGARAVALRDASRRVGVVLASAGYPGPVTTGVPIRGLDDAARMPTASTCFTPARRAAATSVVTAGGRVLTVVGRGADLSSARSRAPTRRVAQISFDGMHYRRDIGAGEGGLR